MRRGKTTKERDNKERALKEMGSSAERLKGEREESSPHLSIKATGRFIG